MKINMQKIDFFIQSAKKKLLGVGRSCPSCGSVHSQFVARKYLVIELRRCVGCKLLFRTPTTSIEENARFYQKEYSQGYTTEMPGHDILSNLLNTGFSGTERDYSRFISILGALGVPQGARILDFGCSWGYGSWQFSKSGYEVESFEISVPRGDYARQNLGCIVHSSLETIQPGFDVFFSSHVLEHVPSVGSVLEFAESVLRPGGIFLAITPNGSMAYRKREPAMWLKAWGLVHPNFLDNEYYEHQFQDRQYFISSSPYDLNEISVWAETMNKKSTCDLSGSELVCIATKRNCV